MQKKVLLFILILILVLPIAADEIEDLKKRVSKAEGRKKIDILLELAELVKKTFPEESLEYSLEALNLAKSINYTSAMADSYHYLAYYYRRQDDFDRAMTNYLKAIELYEQDKRWKELSRDKSLVGFLFLRSGDLEAALDAYQNSLQYDISNQDSMAMAMSYNNIGTVLFRLGNYPSALENIYRSLEIKEILYQRNPESEKKFKRASGYNNIGNIHLRMKNYNDALKAYMKAMEIHRHFPNERHEANALNNIGIVYQQMGEYRKALEYFNRSLKINEKLQERKKIASLMNNIGLVYEKLGDMNVAMHYYQLGLEIKREIGDKYGIANGTKNVGSIYLIFAEYDTAEQFLNESLVLSKEIGARDLVKDNYSYLSDLFAARNDYVKALEFKNRYIALKDSLYDESTAAKLAELETKFLLDKTEREKELLRKDNLIYKLNIEKSDLAKFRLYLMLAFLMVLLAFFYYRYHQKRKINLFLQKSRDELEIKVKQRTSQLATANLELEKEIDERKKVEVQIKESLSEKEILLREIHHRVKNNLQIISSILNLQANEELEPHAMEMFQNTQDRVYSMSLIHEKLYVEDNLARIDARNYISSLINYLMGTYEVDPHRIKLEMKIEDLHFSVSTAVPCGLIVNEIITNSFKYAFPEDRKGRISLIMKKNENNEIELNISDNGVSFSQKDQMEASNSIGMELIRLLTKQLKAQMKLNLGNGVSYKFVIKELNKQEKMK